MADDQIAIQPSPMTRDELLNGAGQLRLALEDITRAYREFAVATTNGWDSRPQKDDPVYTHARGLLTRCPDEIEDVVSRRTDGDGDRSLPQRR